MRCGPRMKDQPEKDQDNDRGLQTLHHRLAGNGGVRRGARPGACGAAVTMADRSDTPAGVEALARGLAALVHESGKGMAATYYPKTLGDAEIVKNSALALATLSTRIAELEADKARLVEALEEAEGEFRGIYHDTFDGTSLSVIRKSAGSAADNAKAALSTLSTGGDAKPHGQQEGGWRSDLENAPRDGTRLNLCWEAFAGLSAHVELGKWKAGTGWCNTYNKPFNGDPDYWMSLPTPPHGQQTGAGSTLSTGGNNV